MAEGPSKGDLGSGFRKSALMSRQQDDYDGGSTIDDSNQDEYVQESGPNEPEDTGKDPRWIRPHIAIWIIGAILGFIVTLSEITPQQSRDPMFFLENATISAVMGYPYFFLMNYCCFIWLFPMYAGAVEGATFSKVKRYTKNKPVLGMHEDNSYEWPPPYILRLFGYKKK